MALIYFNVPALQPGPEGLQMGTKINKKRIMKGGGIRAEVGGAVGGLKQQEGKGPSSSYIDGWGGHTGAGGPGLRGGRGGEAAVNRRLSHAGGEAST